MTKRKHIRIFIFLNFVLTLFNTQGQEYIVNEEFNSNVLNWETDTTDTEKAFIKNSCYNLSINDESYFHWFKIKLKNDLDISNFSYLIETNVVLDNILDSNSTFGLLIGAKDLSNQVQYGLIPKRDMVQINYLENGEWHLGSQQEFGIDCLKPINLKVIITKNKSYLFINQTPVIKFNTMKIYGKLFGFHSSGSGIDVHIQNYLISKYSNNSPAINKLIDLFPSTQRIVRYYSVNGTTFDDSLSDLNIKNSSFYRVYTIDDNDHVVGYVKQYNSKTEKLEKKFQAVYIDPVFRIADIIIGEEFNYDENGYIESKVIYYNQNNDSFYKFGKALNCDFLVFNNSGLMQKYIEIRDGVQRRYIQFNNSEEVEILKNSTEQYYYELNALGKYDRVIHDEFKDTSVLGWPEGNSATSISKITENGYYTVNKKGNIDAGRFIKVFFDLNKSSFSLNSILEFGNLSTTFTILIGPDNLGLNGTAILISPNGFYSIYHIYNGVRIDDIKLTYTPNILSKVNAVDIIKLENSLTVSINGKDLATIEYFPFTKSTIGFSLQGVNSFGYIRKMTLKEINVELPSNMNKFSTNQKFSTYNSSGSGLLLSDNGYIVTNYHVIENAKIIEVDVTLNDITTTYNANIVKIDKEKDLALIRISGTTFPKVLWQFSILSVNLDVGKSVFTIGFPYALTYLGKEIKFADGKISSQSGFDNDMKTYQTTVPVQPGNSGGPLFDIHGNLAGIVNAKFLEGDNVSYAIKSSFIRTFLEGNPLIPALNIKTHTNNIDLVNLIKNLEASVVLIKIK